MYGVGNYSYRVNTMMMQFERERVKTFRGWPVASLTPQSMAAAGFYYIGYGDEVRCAFCKVELSVWRPVTNPKAEHKKYAPQCKFVRGLVDADGGVIPQRTRSQLLHSHAEMMATESIPNPMCRQYSAKMTRQSTFERAPFFPIDPDRMAAAGFFYLGVDDEVRCYHCGGSVKAWRATDDPWAIHALCMPRCRFLNILKGAEYVQRIIIQEQIRAESATINDTPVAIAEVTSTKPIENVSIEPTMSKICKICCKNDLNVCLIPCGHVICYECANIVRNCPMCRTKCSNVVRLYFL